MCCRESTMALNGWLEWTTTHPKGTASPGDTPPIPGTSGQWPLLSRDSLRRIRWVTTIFFSPTATRSAPATPTSFASPMAGRMRTCSPPGRARVRWRGHCPKSRLRISPHPAWLREMHSSTTAKTSFSRRHKPNSVAATPFATAWSFLQQRVTQQRGANDVGAFKFLPSPGYSAFANFLDDFSGPSGSATRVFGAPVFHPDQLHQTYFFQDNWKVTPTLAVTLGLRYENFGQFANTLRYPAFPGFDPSQFLVRHE